ncbi:RNA-binding motif protein, X-linked 2, partial [Cichlidogyrus casuarinus]
MNPLTNVRNQNIINEKELRLGYTSTSSSWHNKFKDSAWIYVGGLDYDLTEGDIICVFSQYGEIVNINLVRDRKTGKSKGFCFICYEDQRSTILATDNLNGIKLVGRIIRVDHVEKYKIPSDGTQNVGRKKEIDPEKIDITDKDAVAAFVREQGCAPEVMRQIEKLQRKEEKRREKRKLKEERKIEESQRCPSPPDYKKPR